MEGTIAADGSLGAGWLIIAGSIVAAAAGLYLGINLLISVSVEEFYMGPSRFTESYANLSKGLTYSSALAAVLAVVALVAAVRHQANAALVVSGTAIGLILLASFVSWLVTPAVGAERRVDIGGGDLMVPWQFRPNPVLNRGRPHMTFSYPGVRIGDCDRPARMSLSFVGGTMGERTSEPAQMDELLNVGPYAVRWSDQSLQGCVQVDREELARTVASWRR